MLNRRNITTGLCLLPLATLIRAQTTRSAPGLLQGAYTKDTAPDATSRAILATPHRRIYGGPEVTDKLGGVHKAFPQIIEQNFAQLSGPRMGGMINSLSEAELSDLAQLYVNATSDNLAPKRLLNVMAHRLPAQQLGRVSRHFGFADVYEAVNAVAPTRNNEFIAASNPNYRGPVVGELRVGPNGRFARPTGGMLKTVFRPGIGGGHMLKTQAGIGKFLNMTPTEIYEEFITTPGSTLGRVGALWEMANVMSSLYKPLMTGMMLGTFVIDPLIQTYAPDVWDAIGGTINQMIENMSNAWGQSLSMQGQVQQSTAVSFGSPPAQIEYFESSGGDFQAAAAMQQTFGGSGGGAGGGQSLNYVLDEY